MMPYGARGRACPSEPPPPKAWHPPPPPGPGASGGGDPAGSEPAVGAQRVAEDDAGDELALGSNPSVTSLSQFPS